jgi:hypothetical protein
LRITRRTQHKEPAAGIEIDLQRIDHRRLAGDELRFETVRQLHELPRDFGIVAHVIERRLLRAQWARAA